MVLIGLIGFKNSGKDTVADYLVRQHGFRKYAFADPVKEICKIMFRLDLEQLHDPVRKEQLDERWGMTPRTMMQKVGTDMIRNMWGEDFWVRNMNARVPSHGSDRVVVSDVRFRNEADWIQQKGGILVRVVDGTQQCDNHPSETEQLSIKEDILLVNPKAGLSSFYDDIESMFLSHISNEERKI